jgi:Zn-dependent protease
MTEKKKGASSVRYVVLLKITKLAKLFKVAKPFMLLLTMSISVIAYAFMLGPWLAVLFVLLLLVHEMGHVAAMKLKGLETPTPVFIPFIGAAIFAPKFKDRHTEAFVGYGGPFLGTIGTLLVFGMYLLTSRDTELSHVLLVGSFIGAFLNLFNMLPISPLDGGRITQAIGPWFKYLGFAGLVILSAAWHQPVILYIWIVVLIDLTIIPLRPRAFVITGCWITMATLMVMGYSDQPYYVDIADCILTILLVGAIISRAVENKTEKEEKDIRPNLHPVDRKKWLILYLGLSIALVVIMAIHLPLMHQLPH